MIELQNICKSYKVARRSAGLGEAVKSLFRREYTRVDALSDVSFTVRDGEMVGYIGPNGAGKSSTIKIMSGVLTPDSGTCVINGRVPWKERTAHVQEIGVVFGQRSQLWWDVPVDRQLRTAARHLPRRRRRLSKNPLASDRAAGSGRAAPHAGAAAFARTADALRDRRRAAA